ncbi:hypothetical protein BGZ68_010879 [Mortierella alpina]|nr:hypothetical protein BGZ68_010879 [Mortierella alpina]
MSMNADQCPRVDELDWSISENSLVLRALKDQIHDFKHLVQDLTGVDEDFHRLMDTTLPRLCHGMPLQCETTDDDDGDGDDADADDGDGEEGDLTYVGEDPERPLCVTEDIVSRVVEVVGLQNAERRRDAQGVRDLLRLGMGPLVAEIRKNLATNLIFELWSSPSDGDFVRVLHNGKVLDTKTGWCDLGWCPFQTFVDYMGGFVTEDLATACEAKESHEEYE